MHARRALIVTVSTTALVLSAVTLGEAASSKSPSTPAKATPPPKALVVTAGALTGLVPGAAARDLGVVVSNPRQNTSSVKIARVTATVRSGLPAGCTVGTDVSAGSRGAYDVLLTTYTAPASGPGIVLERNDVGVAVPLSIELTNRDADQNACRGASLVLAYTATAAGK